MINPEYEGKKYNYAYGQAIVEFERQYLIKKDIADSANDKVHNTKIENIICLTHSAVYTNPTIVFPVKMKYG